MNTPVKQTTWTSAIFLGSLAFVMCLVFFKSLSFPVLGLYDDQGILSSNAFIHDGISMQSIKASLTTETLNLWTPLTNFSYWVDTQIFGADSPKGWRLTNLILHILNSVLLYLFLRALGLKFYSLWLAVLLFALHPLQTEAVCWISERKGLLASSFMLASLCAAARGILAGKSGYIYYSVALSSAILASMSKPSAVVLPCLLLLTYLFLQRSSSVTWTSLPWKRIILYLFPFVIIAGVTAAIAIHFQSLGDHRFQPETFSQRLINLPARLGHYLERFISLRGYSYHYRPLEFGSFVFWRSTLLGSLVLLSTVTLLWKAFRKGRISETSFAPLWLLICLSPVIGLVSVGNSFTSDRYFYLAIIAMGILLGALLQSILPKISNSMRLPLYIVFTVLLALFLGIKTHHQSLSWQNERTLAQSALEVNPHNYNAYDIWARYEAKENNKATAIRLYKKAITLNTHANQSYLQLGMLQYEKGDHLAARGSLEKSLQIFPQSTSAQATLGQLLVTSKSRKVRDLEKGLFYLDQVIQTRPDPQYIKRAMKAAKELNRRDLFERYSKLLKGQ